MSDTTNERPGDLIQDPTDYLNAADAPDREDIDGKELLRLSRLCGQFRILIVGRANSGKTTILERICGSTRDTATIRRNGGQKEPYTQNADAGRGIHNIDDEIEFASKPEYIFHDSSGFEAGSTGEMDGVKRFIKERSTGPNLKGRIHAIWYCLPMDNDRPILSGDQDFFAIDTGGVPVAVIFTKCDGRLNLITSELLNRNGRSVAARRNAQAQAPALVTEFTDKMWQDMQALTCPPSAHVVMGSRGLSHIN